MKIPFFTFFVALLCSSSIWGMKNNPQYDDYQEYYLGRSGKFDIYLRCKSGSHLENKYKKNILFMQKPNTASSSAILQKKSDTP